MNELANVRPLPSKGGLDVDLVAKRIATSIEMYATGDGKNLWVYNAETRLWQQSQYNALQVVQQVVENIAEANHWYDMVEKRNPLHAQLRQASAEILDILRANAGNVPFLTMDKPQYQHLTRQANFQNVVVLQDGTTRERRQDDYVTHVIPYNYEQGDCSLWHEILDFLVVDKEFLMQWIGGCAFPNKFQDGTLCHLQASRHVKDGSNGKSTLLEVLLPKLFDNDQIWKGGNPFSKRDKNWSKFEHVLFAGLDEIDPTKIDASILKDKVNAVYTVQEQKNMQPVRVVNGVHYMTSANGQLRIPDNSEGLLRRLHFCVMKRHIPAGTPEARQLIKWVNDPRLEEQAGAFWYECVQAYLNKTEWSQSDEAHAMRQEFDNARSEVKAILNDSEWFIPCEGALLPQALVNDIIMKLVAKDLQKKDCIDAYRNIYYNDGKKSAFPTRKQVPNALECERTSPTIYIEGYRLGWEDLTATEREQLKQVYQNRMGRALERVF